MISCKRKFNPIESEQRRVKTIEMRRIDALEKSRLISDALRNSGKNKKLASKYNRIVFKYNDEEEKREEFKNIVIKTKEINEEEEDNELMDSDRDHRFQMDERFDEKNLDDSSAPQGSSYPHRHQHRKHNSPNNGSAATAVVKEDGDSGETAAYSKLLNVYSPLSSYKLDDHDQDSANSPTTVVPLPPFHRFDPENPAHLKWVLHHQKSDKEQVIRNENNNDDRGQTFSYKIESHFLKELKQKGKKGHRNLEIKDHSEVSPPACGFSFLASIGRPPDFSSSGCQQQQTTKMELSNSENRTADSESLLITPVLNDSKPKCRPHDKKNAPNLLSNDFVSTITESMLFGRSPLPPAVEEECTRYARDQGMSFRAHRLGIPEHSWLKSREQFVKFYKNEHKKAMKKKGSEILTSETKKQSVLQSEI